MPLTLPVVCSLVFALTGAFNKILASHFKDLVDSLSFDLLFMQLAPLCLLDALVSIVHRTVEESRILYFLALEKLDLILFLVHYF